MPDNAGCGKTVKGLEYMKDEFPEGKPGEEVWLKCMRCEKPVQLHEVDWSGKNEDLTFGEVGKDVVTDGFLRTMRERHEAARMKAMVRPREVRKKRPKAVRSAMKRLKMRTKLKRRVRSKDMKEFVAEVRHRDTEGYSVRQLLQSHIPEIGREVQVKESEVTEALATQALVFFLLFFC